MPKIGMPDVGKVIDALNKRVTTTVTKHPALTAGIIGTGIAASNIDEGAKDTESLIMREQIGAPGSKYAGIKKATAKEAYEKYYTNLKKLAADDYSNFSDLILESAGRGVGGTAAKEGVGAMQSLLRNLYLKAKDAIVQDPKREKIIQALSQTDPVVSTYEQESPGATRQAYQTMRRWAPELSTDENIARSFLRQAAQTGGTLDYPSLKSLTDAEQSALRARKER